MPIELGLVFAAIGCVIGISGFIGGRQNGAKHDGEWKGKLDTNIQYIQNDLKEIKVTMSVTQSSNDEKIAEVKAATKESIANLHDRLDDHLRDEHNLTVPKRRKHTQED